MRYVLMAVVFLFSPSGVARADGGLTGAVANAFLVRYADDGLHAIAHARVQEIAAIGDLDHSGMRAGTYEVLAWNRGEANPIGSAVSSWIGSPLHNGILSNASLGRIGCAEAVVGAVHWFACVLVPGPLPPQPAPQPATQPAPATGSTTFSLPDTAMPVPDP